MPGEGPTSGGVPAAGTPAVPVLLPTLRLASRKLLVMEVVWVDIWQIVEHQDDDMVPSHF